MKPLYIALTLCVFVVSCANYRKIEYNIPEVANTQKAYSEVLAKLDKGRLLYKAYCTKCHSMFTKGQLSIPNFSTAQIKNYGTTIRNLDMENHELIKKLSEEQLNDIMLFLLMVKRPKTTTTPAKK